MAPITYKNTVDMTQSRREIVRGEEQAEDKGSARGEGGIAEPPRASGEGEKGRSLKPGAHNLPQRGGRERQAARLEGVEEAVGVMTEIPA